MTVGTKMHKALVNLESVKADFETFGLDTQDQNAKKMYFEFASELGNMLQAFEGRVNYAESQEPQYKVKQQAKMLKNPGQQ